MAETDDTPEKPRRPSRKLPLLIGLVLALAMGGGGFYAVHSGLILAPAGARADGGDGDHTKGGDGEALALPDVSFVALEPLIINLGRGTNTRHLRFRAQLEVVPKHAHEVEVVVPRVLDVMNSYLRAVSVEDLEDPGALIRIRAQMLRRVKIVTGEGRVRDLLIMEFVLS